MLFENRVQVTAEELMRKYASEEDFKKIKKKPSFEVTKDRKRVDRVNGGVVKSPKGGRWRSHFMATDPRTKKRVEIRYAEANNQKIVGTNVIDQFEPRYVGVTGEKFEFHADLDLAVYQFLHPNNDLSPLRGDNNRQKARIQFIDTKKRSQEKVARVDALATAMAHAKGLSDDRLVILAKGLGIKGLQSKDTEEIRADVLEFAMNYPKVYNEKSASEVTYLEGRIVNLIDKGIVKLSTVGNTRQWKWVKGEREGEHIIEIANVNQDARKALINYFFSDINRHINLLNSITNDYNAREKAERDLAAIENGSLQPYTSDERVIGDALPSHLRTVEPAFSVQASEVYIPTREDAIQALIEAGETEPVHHSKISKWLRENGGE